MCGDGISFCSSSYGLVRIVERRPWRPITLSLIITKRLLQRHNSDKVIRSEFLLLLCPDEVLNEQIRTFTTEAFRSLTKESSFRDRHHLRAFKLSSFFHVSNQCWSSYGIASNFRLGTRSICVHTPQSLRCNRWTVLFDRKATVTLQFT